VTWLARKVGNPEQRLATVAFGRNQFVVAHQSAEMTAGKAADRHGAGQIDNLVAATGDGFL
jgi:hypothetical protein